MKLFAALLLASVLTAAAAEPVTLQWLGQAAPASPVGVNFGVPWPKGAVQPNAAMQLTAANGRRVPVDSRPLAYWPDGSLKWTGHAIAADAGTGAGPFTLSVGGVSTTPVAATAGITYAEDAGSYTIDTGAMRVRVGRQRDTLIESITIGTRVVAEQGRLIALREERGQAGATRDIELRGSIEKVTLEHKGPFLGVVKLEGRHVEAGGARSWLPFVVRLHFYAGSGAIKLTHSFIYDGDGNKDFLKGVGLEFGVPFKEELHNRHIRFAGNADGGVWTQPVRMLPGYRTQAGRAVVDHYPAHLAGQRIPNLSEFDQRTRENILTVPVWADAKLTQLGPNNWSVFKRTAEEHSWLHVTDGQRARGLAVLADVAGGLAVGVKDFWQKSAKSFEIVDGDAATGRLRVWLWSPEAGAMDLSRYSETPHGLSINYEDWKPGWGAPLGIANTHDLMLWAFDRIPANEQLVAMARAAAEPPILVATPEYYHAQQAVGRWSLPDRSTPALRWVEDQVGNLVNYYRDQVEERSWYGFWDFGDIMHNYDFGRHEWRYDVGGWAWVNTELMPDLLLWYSFLRTGRADYFRFAEAMTRHTSEVDVHHVGPFAPLGSRHNVNHWGDGAKQPRVSHAGLKRHYYFLSGGDGRIGDLLREQVDADLAYSYLARFNAAHYVPNADGSARLERAGAPEAPRPENFAPRPGPETRQPVTRFNADWVYYASNWTTEWERGVDPSWRARMEAAMTAIGRAANANGRFGGGTFGMLFGGPEIMFEMEPMYDIPEFWRAWANTAEATGRQAGGNAMTAPRLLAYAAHVKKNAELGRMAWEKLIGPPGALPPLNVPQRISGPDVLKPVTDPSFVGAPVDWQLHGVASVHWALNAIETLEFAKAWLPEWENAKPAPSTPASANATPATNP